jgi:two-component system sensor histidine kinase VanS
MRLTLAYTALFTVAGSVMLVLIYAFMRYVPTYAITSIRATDGSEGVEAWTPTVQDPAQVAQPAEGVTSASGTAALVVSNESEILNTLLVWSLIVLILLAGASAWVGWFMSGRLLRPLHEINVAAQRAATGAFDHRVALAGPRDEITDLSDTFDHMLERLGRSFRAHQRFAANASHELRTPLATTQAMLDVAVRADGVDEETRRLLRRLRETNTRSIRTVEAILDLADLEHSELRAAPVRLDTVLVEALDGVRDAAARRGIECLSELRPSTVSGDAAMLAQLCNNLLENAVRHNVDGGFVQVALARSGGPDGGGTVLRVENSGPPVPSDAVERLTEPFYRAGGRVANGAERSHGLGLAIVESIVEAHGASLQLSARTDGGLTAIVTFSPRAVEA